MNLLKKTLFPEDRFVTPFYVFHPFSSSDHFQVAKGVWILVTKLKTSRQTINKDKGLTVNKCEIISVVPLFWSLVYVYYRPIKSITNLLKARMYSSLFVCVRSNLFNASKLNWFKMIFTFYAHKTWITQSNVEMHFFSKLFLMLLYQNIFTT